MIPELKTFLAVAREGTFAAAARKVGLTQAAVSARMQRLEAELGFALFDRTGRSARLNPRGHETLARADELVRLYEGLGSRRAGARGAARVSLGAIASVQRSVLPEALAAFRREMPECHVRVVPGVSMDLLDRVDAGEIHMAVIIRPPNGLQSDLRWSPLAHEPFRLLVPRGVRGNDWAALLAAHPFVRYDHTSFGGRLVDRFLRAAHIDVREACELDELEAIARLVAQGVGIALVPQTATGGRWPATVRAVSLGARTFHRDIGLVHRAGEALGEPARRLAQRVAAAYAGLRPRAGPDRPRRGGERGPSPPRSSP